MRRWLKALRTEKGLTMKDMGERLCVSESYYSMIENGERQKKMDLIVAAGIAAIFGIPLSHIIELEQSQNLDSDDVDASLGPQGEASARNIYTERKRSEWLKAPSRPQP